MQQRDLSPPGPGDGPPLGAALPRRKIVAVIGIDEYAHLPRLRCAVQDATGLQHLLVTSFGFEAPLPALTDRAATKVAIEALVEDRLRTLLEPDDALLLFFAGHGTTRVAALDNVTIETGYLAPVEARGPHQFSDLINMEELLRKIGMLPARHILVVLDACHSGMALGSAVTQYRSMGSYVHRLAGHRSRRVITSARRDEPALDSGPVPGHSLFTGAMIQALQTGAADIDGNGIITFSELALVLQQGVAQASGSRQTPDYGAFHLDDRGELILGVSEKGHAALRTLGAAPAGPERLIHGPLPSVAQGGAAPSSMKPAHVLALAAGVALFIGVAYQQLQPEPSARERLYAELAKAEASSEWVEHTSAAGRFKVQMPGKPSTWEEVETGLNGAPLSQQHMRGSDGNAFYLVTYADHPPDVINGSDERMLDVAREIELRDRNKLVSEAKIDVRGHVGRQLVFERDEIRYHVRLIAARPRVYGLGIIAPQGVDVSATADRFFSSFEITP